MDATTEVPAEIPGEPICGCGHQKSAHEHYRRGSDCALCAAGVCDKFAAAKPSATARLSSYPRDAAVSAR